MSIESWLRIAAAIATVITIAMKLYLWHQKKKIRELEEMLENKKKDLKTTPDIGK